MLNIDSRIHISNKGVSKNGNILIADVTIAEPQDVYRALGYSYMKFFKMDLLCKWAWLGAELLLTENGSSVYKGIDKSKIAVVLMTSHGCLDVDKKYKASMSDIPSPALFVYTLPNIMLGEICIRHGFKGEQLCLVDKQFNAQELQFWVSDLLENRGMEACLCGWADAYDTHKEISMFWVTKNNGTTPFTTDILNQLYQQ